MKNQASRINCLRATQIQPRLLIYYLIVIDTPHCESDSFYFGEDILPLLITVSARERPLANLSNIICSEKWIQL